jgi:hypothetical protein
VVDTAGDDVGHRGDAAFAFWAAESRYFDLRIYALKWSTALLQEATSWTQVLGGRGFEQIGFHCPWRRS